MFVIYSDAYIDRGGLAEARYQRALLCVILAGGDAAPSNFNIHWLRSTRNESIETLEGYVDVWMGLHKDAIGNGFGMFILFLQYVYIYIYSMFIL